MTAFSDSVFLAEIYEAGRVKIMGLTWEIASIRISSKDNLVGFETMIDLALFTGLGCSEETMTVSEETLKTLTGYTKEIQR